jgi:hypothetical protein
VKKISWSLTKSEELKKTRGVSFEEMIRNELVAVKRHPRLKHQNIMLFKHRGYIWVAPYVESKDEIFLKTMFPSRKYTKLYNKERSL